MKMYASDPARTTFETWGTMERADQPAPFMRRVVPPPSGSTSKAQKAAPLPDWLRRIVG
jgi:acyl-CoA thioester hydrolase